MAENEKELVEAKAQDIAQGGYLRQSLGRSNKQIREERGEAIAEDLELIYKRKVEDLEIDLKRLQRKQVNAFDFSPTNSQSLVMAKEIESIEILERDMDTSLKIREVRIQLNEAKARYNFLFDPIYEIEPVV